MDKIMGEMDKIFILLILVLCYVFYLLFDEISYYGLEAFKYIWSWILLMIICSCIIALKNKIIGGLFIILGFLSFQIYLNVILNSWGIPNYIFITSHGFYLFRLSYIILVTGVFLLFKGYIEIKRENSKNIKK